MEKATATANVQMDIHFDDEPLVAIMGMMSTTEVAAADIMSNIDRLFSELYTTASDGLVLKSGFDALSEVRSTWRFLRKNAGDLPMTCFYMVLVDRILHDASMYDREQNVRHALAVRELVVNLNLAYSQNEPTPLNLRVCTRILYACS